MDTIREFRKHKLHGEVWAIERLQTDKAPAFLGGYRCTRPEEQTRGALPVLTLDHSAEVVEFLEDNGPDLDPWDPPKVPGEHLEAIVIAGRMADEAESTWKSRAAAAKAAKEVWELRCQDMQRLIREAAKGTEAPALPFDKTAAAN
jgi:hypothetical protein